MAHIELTKGLLAIVDNEDFEWLSQWKWHTHWKSERQKAYARRKITRNKALLMHRALMARWGIEVPSTMVIDHINGDGLDNRKENLRIATLSQNASNIQRCRVGSDTGFIGVYHHNGRYRSQIRKISVGVFDTIDEARFASLALCRFLYDDRATPEATTMFESQIAAIDYLQQVRKVVKRRPEDCQLDKLLDEAKLTKF